MRPFPRLLAVLVTVAGLLGACAPPATPPAAPTPATKAPAPSAPTPSSSATRAEKPASTATTRIPRLTVAVAEDGGPLNIYSTDSKFDFLVELVYDKLFAPSPYVETPLPGLAESATQIDHSTWVVKLRTGITWHDGRPFTADDVKFTYESYRDGAPNRHTHHVSDVPRIEQIVAEDARTVRFVCAYPCPTLARITLADLPILPKHVWENVAEPRTVKDLPIGTGPYRLVEHRPDQLYRFQANEQYHHGRPLVDELVMPVVKDPTSTFTALKTGEIDAAAREVPPELLNEFSRLPNLKVTDTAPLSLVELRLNYEKPPFDSADFRRAFSLAIDRRAIVDTVLLGQGRPGVEGYPHPDSPWTKPGLSTPFDREGAKRLLDELGFVDRTGDGVRESPDGRALEFGLMVASTEPTFMRTAELVAKQMLDAGVRLTVQPLDVGSIRRLGTSRTFDVYVNDIGPHGTADPDQFIMSHRSGYLWKAGLPYPEVDALFEEWKRAADVEARKQVSFKMQALFNRQPTAVVVYYPTETWAYRPAAFDQWAEARGFGIVHKWSFLPAEARAGAVVAPR